jgi:hypothetical protein
VLSSCTLDPAELCRYTSVPFRLQTDPSTILCAIGLLHVIKQLQRVSGQGNGQLKVTAMPPTRDQPRHGAAAYIKALLAAALAPALIVACLGVLFLKINEQHAAHAVPADGKRVAAQVTPACGVLRLGACMLRAIVADGRDQQR